MHRLSASREVYEKNNKNIQNELQTYSNSFYFAVCTLFVASQKFLFYFNTLQSSLVFFTCLSIAAVFHFSELFSNSSWPVNLVLISQLSKISRSEGEGSY